MSNVIKYTHKNVDYFYDPVTDFMEYRVPDVRETIRAGPGNCILSCDYSQIEIKIMAFLAQDPALIDAINSGKDIHSYIATDLFGAALNFDYDLIIEAKNNPKHIRHSELSKLRSDTKSVVFSIPYGAGPKKVAFLTGMSIDDAAEFINVYLGRYTKLKEMLADRGLFAITNLYSESIGCRKRFYEPIDPSSQHFNEIISQVKRYGSNGCIQASCSDILKYAIALIYNRVRGGDITKPPIYSGRLRLVVHDEIVMEWSLEEAGLGEAIIVDCMSKAYDRYITGIINPLDVTKASYWKK